MPVSSANVMDQRAKDTRVAQFILLCGNLVWIILGTLSAALALFLALQEALPLRQRLPWLMVIILLTAARTLLLRHWTRCPTTHNNVNLRIVVANVMAFFMACLFGLLAYLAVSESNPLTSVLVVMVLTGMVASATASVSHLLPMYVLFIFPIMLPVAYRLSGFEQAGYHWIAGLILLYLVVCLGTSRSIRSSIMHSINVRFDNLDLLEDVRREKRRAEVALRNEEQANHAKSRFLAAASHDLRQPLHSLRLFTATLELQTRDTKHKTLVSQIDSSVKSLEDLFNALLDISKLDAGTFTVEKEHIHLDILLSQIEGEFKALAEEKQLRFSVELQDHVVFTDALLLERLLRNIANNAVRYTDTGEVTLSTRQEVGNVVLSVSDTGIGIPRADQEKIFDEFVQLGNVERNRSQGIGLGLSIVKRLSALLDLEVDVQSSPAKGSVFSLSLPLGDRAKCKFIPSYNCTVAPLASALFVLVIDDEEEACLAVEGLLETWGCIVMTASSGDAAIKQLEEIGEVPDILISDYRLRDGETGGDVIQSVRDSLQQTIPAIILTGDIAPERLQDIKALGYPMLHKPCEPEALRRLIAVACKSTDQPSGALHTATQVL